MWVFWWCCSCWCGGGIKGATWLGGGCGWGWLVKNIESCDDSARESYSSSAPLEDCKLPLVFAESMRAENGKTWGRQSEERFWLLAHRTTSVHLRGYCGSYSYRMRYGSETKRERDFFWLWKDKLVFFRKCFLPHTSLRLSLCKSTATGTQCLNHFYLICVCTKGCYVNKGINRPRMIMHLIYLVQREVVNTSYSVWDLRGWEKSLLCLLPLSLSWVLDYHYRLWKGSSIRVSREREKEEREGKKEKDSSLAFFSYKRRGCFW